MSRWRSHAKALVERLPYPAGRVLSHVPFAARLGPTYTRTRRLMRAFSQMGRATQRSWILKHLQEIVSTAYERVPFYRNHYEAAGYRPSQLKSLEDFRDVPIVTKADLRSVSLEERSHESAGRMLLNTGGTSGEPLEFYLDRSGFAREWAHMHWIWRNKGYEPAQTKLTLRGHNLGNHVIKYNAVHNEFIVNSYSPWDQVVVALDRLLERAGIAWVHGYPSLVAEFADFIDQRFPDLAVRLSANLRGVLLGSEYPAPIYRSRIENVLSRNVVAWYGHSEMCILAYERAVNEYVPLHTYGYSEAVPSDKGIRLVGTSYWNTASPLIRYDTGDTIEAETGTGSLLSSFAVEDGRIGEFVLDKAGRKISLTALIFGRHHPAFNRLAHVQVRQTTPGHIELLLVPRQDVEDDGWVDTAFDFSNTALDVDYQLIDAPIRTDAGKIRLLVSENPSG